MLNPGDPIMTDASASFSEPSIGETADSDTGLGADAAFGARVAEARMRKGYSISELARLVGVSKVSAWHWEQGISLPHPDRVRILAEVLSTDPGHLLFGPARYPAPSGFRDLRSLLEWCQTVIADLTGVQPDDVQIVIRSGPPRPIPPRSPD